MEQLPSLRPTLNITAVNATEAWVEKTAATAEIPPRSANDVVVLEGEKKAGKAEDVDEAVKKEIEGTEAINERTKEKIAKVAAAEKRVGDLK